ncbi:endonuclease/exonuclease/phosphatase family protein [Paludibacterium purpuratum]|uniref:Endonuclease/exonuclease/phosphatase family metal-dependent hydrolase n=1 Tax=Paludibacterium purpuratum TaxID=1144873 RepID=A0A4R7BAL6_9NEIS|nr:endonuclease/exonuclease/phosphatase family protein [Paludibacterium purpuratum]TDR81954.1 endonuclease/exonuclease/phosphatase family metal-dependent hydrolase [Paludibacterium purpuratum]
MDPLRVITFNMHKGMSPLNRRVRLEGIARALDTQAPDLVFLQEVQGKNQRRALYHADWSSVPQHHFLARRLNLRAAYGLNAAYEHGHHGNAVLTRFPIESWCNLDISVNAYESRGVLHCQLRPAGWPTPVVALCAHLNLLGHDRRKQYHTLANYIRHNIPPELPLILAGDFNDWRGQASHCLQDEAGLTEVHLALFGSHARSFPARMPMLTLDRIYVRGLRPVCASVLGDMPWPHLSDHLPLTASLLPILV